MTDNLISPERPITLEGKKHTLHGSVHVLKEIQQEFDKDIYDIAAGGTFQMRFDELAKLFRIGIGEDAPTTEVVEQEIVEEMGIGEAMFLAHEWLTLAVSPKREREKT